MVFIRFSLYHKFFILFCVGNYTLFWFIGFFTQSIHSGKISISDHDHVSIANIYFILEYLSRFNISLLLIDPVVLDYLFIRQLLFQNLQERLITFGVSPEHIQAIYSVFSHDYFSLTISKCAQNISINHIFIKYNQNIVHLAILHDEHSYFLIQKNSAELPIDVVLSYGDTVRVIEPVTTEIFKNKVSFYYPQNVSHFLWLYQTSEFLDCDRTLADEMEKKFNLYQNSSLIKLTLKPMRSIVSILNRLEKHNWLAGGTLLGWYRHCGLIPYTQDVDFGLFAEEYDEGIRNHFLGNPIVYLWGALGLVNDSLEFRLFTGSYTFDLFWAYHEDDHRWCGYQIGRLKYKRFLPSIPKLCSADLFGYRFSIPCSPVDYLNNEYGYDKWRSPLEKDYKWINVKYHSIWDDISWMYATRLYTPQGKLRQDKYALNTISDKFSYTMKTIPSFLNVLPDEPVTLPPLKS